MGECNYPVGCIGNASEPQCVYRDILAYIDFCGVCNGDNADCFFSSVLPTSTIAGIAGGVTAGIVVAAIVGVVIFVVLSKKGYDYYISQSQINAASMHQNPYYSDGELQGDMLDVTMRPQ